MILLFSTFTNLKIGEVAEWLNAHAWKACLRKRNGGSNPPLSASALLIGQERRDENLEIDVPNERYSSMALNDSIFFVLSNDKRN